MRRCRGSAVVLRSKMPLAADFFAKDFEHAFQVSGVSLQSRKRLEKVLQNSKLAISIKIG